VLERSGGQQLLERLEHLRRGHAQRDHRVEGLGVQLQPLAARAVELAHAQHVVPRRRPAVRSEERLQRREADVLPRQAEPAALATDDAAELVQRRLGGLRRRLRRRLRLG